MASPYDEVGVKVLRAQQRLVELRGLARVGGVTIEVDSKGHMLAIAIDPQAFARGPGAVSDLILYAYRQAVEDVEPRAAMAMQELMNDPKVARVVDMTTQSSDQPPRKSDRPVSPRSSPAADAGAGKVQRAPLAPPPRWTSPVVVGEEDDWNEDDEYFARKRREGWLE